jgi:ABC-type Mn2+/Zn2+ transport system ATPase subunit
MANITGPRGGGKTIALIRLCAEQGGYIVCQSHQAARRIQQMAQEMGLNIPFPITFEDLLEKRLNGRGCSPLHVDNADLLVSLICRNAGAQLGNTTTSSEE